MVSFSHVLDSEGAEAIHAYLIKRGHDAIEERRLLAEQSRDSAPAGNWGFWTLKAPGLVPGVLMLVLR